MKFRYTLILFAIFTLVFLSSCASLANNDLEPSVNPTETATLSIQIWGELLPTSTSTLGPEQTTETKVKAESTTTKSPTKTQRPAKTKVEETKSPIPSPTPEPIITFTAQPTFSGDPNAAITTLLFTGSIVPARCVQKAIDTRGNPRYIYQDIEDILMEADLTIGTLNAALSDYPPHTGWCENSSFVLVGRSNNADVMADVGFDVMNIATNHIKNCGVPDCGDRTFLDTLDNLERVGIPFVGGGRSLEDALDPIVISVNGIRFGFVALGADYGANTFSTNTTPGIAELSEENLEYAINRAKEISDVVIVMPHWGADYPTNYAPNSYQRYFGREIVKLGADLVVGNHSHVFQGMQFVQEIPVFYSLGSFIFDQTWQPEGFPIDALQQGLVIRVTFIGTEYAWHDMIPVHIDGDGHVQVAEVKEAADIYELFQQLNAELE